MSARQDRRLQKFTPRALKVIRKVLKLAGVQSQEERDTKLYNDLLHHEARIGGKLFGPIQQGHKREFFCLDESTWIWHEEWQDKSGQRRSRTTRYSVRPGSIVKTQDGQPEKLLTKNEAARFFDAVRAYDKNVKHQLYQRT